jgi:opacity protein-like surface antigen
MTRTLLGVTALVASLAATPALAENGFDGPYGGLKVGYGFGQADVEYTEPGYSATYEGLGSEGPAIGLLAGYGRTFGQDGALYLGGELDAVASDISTEVTESDGDRAELSEQYSGIAAIRGGFLPAENWMIYGRLGAGYTQYELEATSGGASGSSDETQATYLAGVGVEGFVTDNVSLRLDWSYRVQDDEEVDVGNSTTTVEPTSGLAEIAVSYHF